MIEKERKIKNEFLNDEREKRCLDYGKQSANNCVVQKLNGGIDVGGELKEKKKRRQAAQIK